MGGGGGMQGGGQHMVTCPLCRGQGSVPPRVAQEAQQMMQSAPAAQPSIVDALRSRGGGMGGGRAGHGGM
jgi:hypothetical protein